LKARGEECDACECRGEGDGAGSLHDRGSINKNPR